MTLTQYFKSRATILLAGGLLAVASDNGYSAAREGVTTLEGDGCGNETTLAVNFENKAAPAFFGAASKGAFNGDESTVNDKWFAMLGRHYSLLQNPENAATWNAWLSQLDGEKGKSIAERAMAVDELVDNSIKYIIDAKLYGDKRDDYWASPIETLAARHNGRNGWGDCEDYAFLKYFALRHLDVPVDRIYGLFVHVTDEKGNREGHLVTAVDVVEASGAQPRFVILNNQQTPAFGGQLELESEHKNYTPYYAFNENGPLSIPANSKGTWGEVTPRGRVCIDAKGLRP